jgi:predicted component of type VI protein secretion system
MKQVPFTDIVKQGHSNQASSPQEYVAEEVFRMASQILQNDQTKFVEVMEAAQNRGYFDVKLTIDGIEGDPALLGVIYQNINEFIERRAGQIAAEKFKESMQEVEALGNIVEQAKNKIMEKYNIKEEE